MIPGGEVTVGREGENFLIEEKYQAAAENIVKNEEQALSHLLLVAHVTIFVCLEWIEATAPDDMCVSWISLLVWRE
jgi:hypothetical protein